jgi:hypothetical protein
MCTLTKTFRIRHCHLSTPKFVLIEIRFILEIIVQRSPNEDCPNEAEIFQLQDLIEDLNALIHKITLKFEEFVDEFVVYSYHQKAFVWFQKYEKDLEVKTLHFHLIQQHNFRLANLRVFRDLPFLSTIDDEDTQNTRLNILQCHTFPQLQELFRFSSLPRAIECLRGSLEYLRPFHTTTERDQSEILRFWKIQTSVTIFLDLMSIIFDENEKFYSSLSLREQEQILFTIRASFESLLLVEKILCLFFSANEGLPWIPGDGVFDVNLNSIRCILLFAYPLQATIDPQYVHLVTKYFPNFLSHLMPCVPLRCGKPDDTDKWKWVKKFVKLPGKVFGSFWELEKKD